VVGTWHSVFDKGKAGCFHETIANAETMRDIKYQPPNTRSSFVESSENRASFDGLNFSNPQAGSQAELPGISSQNGKVTPESGRIPKLWLLKRCGSGVGR
jgi:hypothetical protein